MTRTARPPRTNPSELPKTSTSAGMRRPSWRLFRAIVLERQKIACERRNALAKLPATPLSGTDLAGRNRPPRTGMAGAEGATAPETLRQKDQQGAVGTLERSAKALAEGITISGEGTEGALAKRRVRAESVSRRPRRKGAKDLEGAFWTYRLISRKPRFMR